MGTHLRALRKSYPMNTNSLDGFINLWILALWVKVALALEGLTLATVFCQQIIHNRQSWSQVLSTNQVPTVEHYAL